MILSKLDTFCWKKSMGTSAGTVYTDALDFGAHGDDVLKELFFTLWCSVAAADTSASVVWETSANEPTADEANSDASKVEVDTWSLTAAQLALGAFPIANVTLPKGLKRYNRLKITTTAGSDATVTTKVYPTLSAFIIDGRDEPIVK